MDWDKHLFLIYVTCFRFPAYDKDFTTYINFLLSDNFCSE